MTYKNVLKSVSLCFALFGTLLSFSYPPNCSGFTLTTSNSNIQNADFEDRSCCSETISFNGYNGLDCVHSFNNISEGTSDVWNPYCGLATWWECPNPPPNSSPSFVGIIYGNDWKEYIGTCLINPLESDKNYNLKIKVGFGIPHSQTYIFSYSPTKLMLYGNSNCSDLFFKGTGCPTDGGNNWVVLGEIVITGGNGEWIDVNITFTPQQNINAIAIGAPCGYSGSLAYYFLDDLILTETLDLEEPFSLSIDGDLCEENITLSAASISNVNYQWYHNNNPINGATFPQYVIPTGMEGDYQVVLSNSTGCLESEIFYLDIPDSYTAIYTLLCYGDSISIGNNTYHNTGIFIDTLINMKGCDSIITLNLTIHEEITYNLSVEEILCFADSTLVEVIPVNQNNTILWNDGATSFQRFLFSGTQQFVLTNELTGCTQSKTFEIEQPDELIVEVHITNISCIGNEDGVIEVRIQGGVPPYFIKINSQPYTQGFHAIYLGLAPDEFEILVIDSNHCIYKDNVEIDEPENPYLKILVEQNRMNLGEVQDLQLVINNDSSNLIVEEVNWSHPSLIEGNDFLVNFTADSLGIYDISVSVTDINGCIYYTSTTIIVKCADILPTAFSPNGDGVNDTFYPQGAIHLVEELAIYSRWGNGVFKQHSFSANTSEFGWDGNFKRKPLEQGVYVWTATVVFIDGTVKTLRGDVLLIR